MTAINFKTKLNMKTSSGYEPFRCYYLNTVKKLIQQCMIIFLLPMILICGIPRISTAEDAETIYSIRVGSISTSSPVLYQLAQMFPKAGFKMVQSKLKDRSLELKKKYVILLSMEGDRSKKGIKKNKVLAMAKQYGIPVIVETGLDGDIKSNRIKKLHGFSTIIPRGDVFIYLPGNKSNRLLKNKVANRVKAYSYIPEAKSKVRFITDSEGNTTKEEISSDDNNSFEQRITEIADHVKKRIIKRYVSF